MSNRKITADNERTLWSRSGGHCEICGETLYRGSAANTPGNHANRAHIYAFSENGPRGQSPIREGTDRDSVDNLMMLCGTCHHEIDQNVDKFPVELLRHAKEAREHAIEALASQRTIREVEALRCCVPVGGEESSVSTDDIQEALLSDNRMFGGNRPWDLGRGIDPEGDIQQTSRQLEKSFRRDLETGIDGELPFAVFALAPQPILIKLGTLIGDKRSVYVYQRQRESSSWTWNSEAPTAYFSCSDENVSTEATDALLIASISGNINDESLCLDAAYVASPRFFITTDYPSVNVADSPETLEQFRRCIVDTFAKIHESCPKVTTVHVFPAMPVSLNVIFGCSFNFNLIGKMIVYEKTGGRFVPALTIGAE